MRQSEKNSDRIAGKRFFRGWNLSRETCVMIRRSGSIYGIAM
jgi:hypothetical protein